MSSPVEPQSEADATAPIVPGTTREPAPGRPALHPAALRRDLVADLEALMDASHEPSEAFPLPTVDGDVRRTEQRRAPRTGPRPP